MSSNALKQSGKSSMRNNLLLILLVIALAVAPLFLAKNAEFTGSDGEAEKAITEINADYVPWFSSVFEPPSGEIESLLFSAQAAVGAGIIGYGLGYFRGRRAKQRDGEEK